MKGFGPPNFCPECGVNSHLAANAETYRREAMQFEAKCIALTAELARERSDRTSKAKERLLNELAEKVLTLEMEVSEAKLGNRYYWLQRKVAEQAKVITTLERRIRHYGRKPYSRIVES